MAGGFHDGVSKLWVTRIDKRSLDVDGFDDEAEAIGALIRCAMVRDSSDAAKARIRAAVDDALRHMDEDSGPVSDAPPALQNGELAPRTCNRHVDCDAADERAKANGLLCAEHCRDECCEDCFGN